MKKILVFSDVHAPYDNVKSVGLMLNVANDFKPDIIVANGDIADFYAVSAHRRDPRRGLVLDDEVYSVNVFLSLVDAIGAKEKWFIEGNHENRLERYLMDKADALVGLRGTDVPTLFDLDERGWNHVPYKDYVQIGKVTYTHDLDYAGKHVATRAVADAQHSIVVGHAHRIGYVVEGDATGTPKVGACFGWLGDASQANYKHRLKANRDWAQGFGVGYMDSDGTTWFVPVPIVNDRAVVEGRIYRP